MLDKILSASSVEIFPVQLPTKETLPAKRKTHPLGSKYLGDKYFGLYSWV